jgi:hypothetical protein
MPRFLGIDPGAKGSFCILDPWGDIIFDPAPTAFKSSYNLFQGLKLMVATIGSFTGVAVEDVHSLYGMSAKSNFNFGRNVQAVTSLLQHIPIEFELIQPKKWQVAVGIQPQKGRTGKQLKTEVAGRAITLYGSANLFGPRGGLLDGRADALMIAHYLYLQWEIVHGLKAKTP